MSEQLADLVAAELRAEIGRRALTNRSIAEKIGVSDMWVSRRLRGLSPITVADLALFAEAVGVPASKLVEAAERVPAVA